MFEKTLGILQIESEPLKFPGGMSYPGTFDFPVRRLMVRGATTPRVIDGDKSICDAFVTHARQLEHEGVAAIVSNCGFTGLFQAEVSAAVSIPVALSTLVMVPFVASTLPPGRKVGILTYDSDKLTDEHFVSAGWSRSGIPVSIAGIQGTDTWRRFLEPVPDIKLSELIGEVLMAARSLLKRDPEVGALVFECTAFPLAADTVRSETGLPVFDVLGLGRMLIEMSAPRKSHTSNT
ncbi:aspartate/glutamate racemase family protein [Paraburkholderia phenoliruptrix]|uniref:aspartate/glutamate racemase family protein n=1 Tax=Paraburkholderia phenoliruptrix TaxID=252970 RepID=UPI0028698D85|nr:aspartate/glutamate racemase family protein [Paraburkholderia phenoliruptrix]WMY11049.1 aspartate/glutamate racemase family protein [Paraburkholderia phenoliruptrix]